MRLPVKAAPSCATSVIGMRPRLRCGGNRTGRRELICAPLGSLDGVGPDDLREWRDEGTRAFPAADQKRCDATTAASVDAPSARCRTFKYRLCMIAGTGWGCIEGECRSADTRVRPTDFGRADALQTTDYATWNAPHFCHSIDHRRRNLPPARPRSRPATLYVALKWGKSSQSASTEWWICLVMLRCSDNHGIGYCTGSQA
jgi:hypothetical protein